MVTEAAFRSRTLMTARTGLKRTAIKRTPFLRRKPAILRLPDGMKSAGKPWPAAWMDEKTWQECVIDYAFHGDSNMEHFHVTNPQSSRAGFFDLTIFQPTRGVGIMVELKVRDMEGHSKSPSKAQWKFIAAGVACGYDVRSWLWPDDAVEAWETLTGRPYEECWT